MTGQLQAAFRYETKTMNPQCPNIRASLNFVKEPVPPMQTASKMGKVWCGSTSHVRIFHQHATQQRFIETKQMYKHLVDPDHSCLEL